MTTDNIACATGRLLLLSSGVALASPGCSQHPVGTGNGSQLVGRYDFLDGSCHHIVHFEGTRSP